MTTRKILKIVLVLFLTIAVLATLNFVCAADVPVPTGSTVSGDAQTAATNIVGALITIIQVVAFGAAVIMLMFLGIKYITASPDGKAEIKKSATQYIVGAVILFAASGILTIIKNFALNNVG